MSDRIGIIVQARMTSKRFPGKVAAVLNHQTVLARVLKQCLKVPGIDEVICAFPRGVEHHQISDICHEVGGVRMFAGDEDNVLKRYLEAAKQYRLDTIIRITADCPFVNPLVIYRTLDLYLKAKEADGTRYASNVYPSRSFPKGYDVEVFAASALRLAEASASGKHDLEHVTPWIQRNVKTKCMIQLFEMSWINLCVDWPGDIPRLEPFAREFDAHVPTTFDANAK